MRKGDVKFLDKILDTAKETRLSQMRQKEYKFKDIENPDSTADQIGMTCVKIQDMQSKRWAISHLIMVQMVHRTFLLLQHTFL